MQRLIQTVAGGNLAIRARFREGDELQELKDEFNRMMDALQERLGGDRRSVEALAGKLDDLLSRQGTAPPKARDCRDNPIRWTRSASRSALGRPSHRA